MAKVALDIKNIHTQFGTQVIHQDISFQVYAGEILGIVGGSGSGKSVLMNYLIGLNTPQKGSVIYHAPFSKHAIGVLFQQGALLSSLTVLENIMLPLQKVLHLDQEIAKDLSLLKLRDVGLSERDASKYPSNLSGGMVKRVGIARALAMEPKILFLDEPTAGLDPITASDFDDLILMLKKSFDLTIVMITHDLDTLSKTCDRIAVLVDQNIKIGTLEEISHNSHPWMMAYFQGVRGRHLFSSNKGH